MSKKIISIHNTTNAIATFRLFSDLTPDTSTGPSTVPPHPSKRDNLWTIPPQEFFGNWDGTVPVNDNSASYYAANHLEITLYTRDERTQYLGEVLGSWSLWANNWRTNFTVQYVNGIGWEGRPVHTLRGGDKGGDGTFLKLHISEHPCFSNFHDRYQLSAVAITPAEQARQTAETFKTAIPKMGISKQSSKDDLKGALQSSYMDDVKAQASQRGFQSLGVLVGGGGSVGVGAEVCTGWLTGLSGESAGSSYSITSTAVTVGAEEGATGFIGVYMSTEPADSAGGLEFFSEVGAGLGVGVAYRDFATWGGEVGQMVMVTTGEELELSVGIGDTVVVGG